MKRNFLGKITLKNDVVVSDPGYELDCWCLKVFDKNDVRLGKYNSYVVNEDKTGLVMSLDVVHEDFDDKIINNNEYKAWKDTMMSLGVDSGQMCVCDIKYYHPEKESWYETVCNVTDVGKYNGGIFENRHGAVSRTMYGDGMYPLYVLYDDDGMICGFHIDFRCTED